MAHTAARGRRSSQRGAVAVEFALIVPLFALLVFGIIQYGYYFYATQSASSAAREAARASAVGNCTADTDLSAYVATKLSGLSYDDLTVARSYSPTQEVGNTVSVSVTFTTLDLNFPFLPVPNDGQVVRTFDTRVEDLDAGSCA